MDTYIYLFHHYNLLDDFLSDYHEFSKDDDGFNSMQAQRTDYPDFYKRNYQDKYSNKPKKLEQFK